jgi:hypothetical protein
MTEHKNLRPAASAVLTQAVGDLPVDLEQLQLTRLAPSSIQQALQCTSIQQLQQNGNAESLAGALENLSCGGDDEAAGSSSNQQEQQQQERLPCLQVAAVEGDDASGVQLVRGLQLLFSVFAAPDALLQDACFRSMVWQGHVGWLHHAVQGV